MDRKKTRIGTIMLMLGVAISGNAQSGVTYNYDSSKKNQITVMEIGSGSLSPELYYQLLHSSYKKSAASKNKLGFRTTAGIGAYNQVEYAEAIDSALTKRAEIEALNMADRQIDLAWKVEGSKINSKMNAFKSNIDRILPVGGSIGDKQRWTEYYHVYETAIKATKDAYMPNAKQEDVPTDLCRCGKTERDTCKATGADFECQQDQGIVDSKRQLPDRQQKKYHQ